MNDELNISNVTVTKQHVTEASDIPQGYAARYITEASQIGIKPGQVPDRIPTTLGNGMDFELEAYDENDGTAAYGQQGSAPWTQLIVLND